MLSCYMKNYTYVTKSQISGTPRDCYYPILDIISMGLRSGEFAGQSSTPTPWSFNQLLVLLAVWAGAKSCWKIKSASLKKTFSRRKHEVLQNVLVNGCSAVGFQKKTIKKTMDQHQQMTSHPKSSQTVET